MQVNQTLNWLSRTYEIMAIVSWALMLYNKLTYIRDLEVLGMSWFLH